jgi:hypothetical protein
MKVPVPKSPGQLKPVAGVFGTGTILPEEQLALRNGRRGHELIQGERVVAFSEFKPQLLSFAAINGLAVRDYTKPGPAQTPPVKVYDLSIG